MYPEIIKIFQDHVDPESTYVVLEKQHCMPGEGLTRTFKTGFGFGMYIGILETLRLPYSIVGAREWQNKVLLDYPKTMPIKERSIANAKHRFNMEHLYRTERAYTDHDGKADALNIVLYGKILCQDPLSLSESSHEHKLNKVKVCITCGEYVV